MTPADPLAPFMPSILADPASDAPRLVAADYLTDLAHARGEEDDPRAEFIRVQVELDAFPHVDAVRGRKYDARDGVSPEWQRAFDLHDREMRLLWAGPSLWQANWVNWCWCWCRDEEGRPTNPGDRGGMVVTPHGSPGLGDDPQSCAVPGRHGLVRQVFRRGFVASLTLPFRDWIAHAKALRDATPLEQVRVTGVEPLYDSETRGWGWYRAWRRTDVGDGPEYLPPKLFNTLCAPSAVTVPEYPTCPLALSALAAACGECWPGIEFTVGGVTP